MGDKMKRIYKIVIIASFLIMLVLIGVTISLLPKKIVDNKLDHNTSIFSVEITGEVLFPGKYKVVNGDTLEKLISYAGGFTYLSNKNINLQEELIKNKKYYIKKEIDLNNIIKKDLNKIKYDELLQIDHITENRALNIIVYRATNKKFKSVEELKKVKDIGEKTFDKIKDYFFVE